MTFRLPDLRTSASVIRRAQERLHARDEERADRQVLACRCAKSDKPFTAVFIRQRGRPRYGLEAVRAPDQAADNSATGTAPAKPHDIRHFALDALSCPNCGQKKFTKCGRCGAFVCDARSERRRGGLYFRCAPSCGSEGPIGTLTTIETTGPAGQRQLTRSAAPPRLPKPKT
jgi:hypothetical protein